MLSISGATVIVGFNRTEYDQEKLDTDIVCLVCRMEFNLPLHRADSRSFLPSTTSAGEKADRQ